MDDQLTLAELLSLCIEQGIHVEVETMVFPARQSMVQVVLKKTSSNGIVTTQGLVMGHLLRESRIDPVVREIAFRRRELMKKVEECDGPAL
jgi:hypothetical protein